MNRDWLVYFKSKRGMGAVICEGPEIEAACAEIEALLARHNALVEAVAWEMECREVIWPAYRSSAYMELIGTKDAARAEVDHLLQEEKP